MEIERRSCIMEVRVNHEDDKSTRVVGHAAVFNKLSEDLGGFREQIIPGAFKESIKEDDIRALFNHDPNFILARNKAATLSLKEDSEGLAISFEPPDTQAGRDLVISLDRGDVDQMSFGFSVKPNGQNWGEDKEGNIVRTLTNVRLFDVSPVVYPAYPQTDVAKRELRGYIEDKKEVPLDIYYKELALIE